MSTINPDMEKMYEKTALPSGGFAIVALDQRDSLRAMFSSISQTSISDEKLINFKVSVAEILSPYASAMLFDRYYGMEALDVAKSTNSKCGIIVAADHLIQEPGQIVTDTELDYVVDPHKTLRRGATAMKFMIIWKSKHYVNKYIVLAEKFLERCHTAGLLGVVEVIVRNPNDSHIGNWNREEELLEAAQALGSTKPDLYKTEVPFYGDAHPSEIQGHSESMSAVLPCPWVVLSSGVNPEKFPVAVQAACKGGASGFLAGRGIWQDAIRANPDEYRERLLSISVNRLLKLVEIVDESAKSWRIFK